MGGGKGGGDVTVGYKYYMGLHGVICYGPVNSVRKFVVGERTAWEGNVTSSTRITVSQPELFGGEDREGGISGKMDLEFGESTQTPNDYLQARVGALSAHRGVLGFVARQMYVCANNPYLKPWSFMVTRNTVSVDGGDVWYKTKAAIGLDMNPAHIIHECLTNNEWGMGYPATDLNQQAFINAADKLYEEGFGLSMAWMDSVQVQDFVTEVLTHIDGSLYQDPQDGQLVLALVRETDTPVMVLDESNAELVEYKREGWGETANEITIVYTNRETGKEYPYTVQNIANIALQGGVISKKIKMLGINEPALARKVASRELAQASTPRAMGGMRINRQGQQLRIGDVVQLDWPTLGISGMRLRVASAKYGSLEDGTVEIDFVEDSFDLSLDVFDTPRSTEWENPNGLPVPVENQRLLDAPYYYVAQNIGDDDAEALTGDDVTFVYLAERPTVAINFNLQARPSGGVWKGLGYGDFTPTAVLNTNMDKVRTNINVLDPDSMERAQPGTSLLIDDEFMKIVAIDPDAGTITVGRGVFDTVPKKHSTGAKVWFFGTEYTVTNEVYMDGEGVDVVGLTKTSYGTLPLADATSVGRTLDARYMLPYPPGNLRVNGAAYPKVQTPQDPSITWAHRDRTIQTNELIATSFGDIGPEVGTTYWLRVYDEDGNAVVDEATLTGTSFDYLTEIDDLNKTELAPSGVYTIAGTPIPGTPITGYISWANGYETLALDSTPPSYVTLTEDFSLRYTGVIYAPEDGTYVFALDSDDASDFLIEGQLVASFYGGHGFDGSWNHTGSVYLTQGEHSFTARLTQGTSGYGITVGWQKPSDTSISVVPESAYVSLRYEISADDQPNPDSKAEMDSYFGGLFGTGSNRRNTNLNVKLKSQRDSLDSYQEHDFTVERDGWGYNWDNYYGGH